MSSRNDDNHRFSPINWYGQVPGPNGTGWAQHDAGQGKFIPERVRRGGGRAPQGPHLYALPDIPSMGMDQAAAFGYEVARESHRSVAGAMVRGAAIGVLSYALVRKIRGR
jgi:hypothetical protein